MLSKEEKTMKIIKTDRKDLPYILNLENGTNPQYFTEKALIELKNKIIEVLM